MLMGLCMRLGCCIRDGRTTTRQASLSLLSPPSLLLCGYAFFSWTLEGGGARVGVAFFSQAKEVLRWFKSSSSCSLCKLLFIWVCCAVGSGSSKKVSLCKPRRKRMKDWRIGLQLRYWWYGQTKTRSRVGGKTIATMIGGFISQRS